MKKNNLFASMAGKVLALAAAMMMSVAFTACSSDDDKPSVPEQKPNTVTIDGVTMPVVSAEYTMSEASADFSITLNLPEKKGSVRLSGNADQHIGKDIDLTVKEPAGKDGYWFVDCFDDTHGLFNVSGSPRVLSPAFITGTLRIDGNMEGDEVSVSLKNGKVKTDGQYGDGKEHTISISWKGKPARL